MLSRLLAFILMTFVFLTLSICQILSLARLSKAFWRSTKLTYRLACHSTLCSMMLRRMYICSIVPRPFLNPACSGLSFSSTAVTSLSIRILPSNLLAVGRRETSLELSQIVRLLFFAIIEIRLFFQSYGTISLSQIFNKLCSSITDNSMSAFHISAVIPSMPGALSSCILFKFLLTSSVDGGSRLIFSKFLPACSSSSTDSSTGISQGMFNTSLKCSSHLPLTSSS